MDECVTTLRILCGLRSYWTILLFNFFLRLFSDHPLVDGSSSSLREDFLAIHFILLFSFTSELFIAKFPAFRNMDLGCPLVWQASEDSYHALYVKWRIDHQEFTRKFHFPPLFLWTLPLGELSNKSAKVLTCLNWVYPSYRQPWYGQKFLWTSTIEQSPQICTRHKKG